MLFQAVSTDSVTQGVTATQRRGHRGEACQELISKFEEIAQKSPAPAWDDQYRRFELLLRHDFHGEPRSAGENARFFPKLRPLRDALLAYESYKHETDSSWSFFSSLLPRIFRVACSTYDEPKPGHTLSPSQVASFLSNAFLLNAPGPLDFLSSGKDPLFVSGAKIAPQKVLCLLAYLDEALEGLAEASDERTISFERVSGPDWEQVEAPVVQQALHETVELVVEGEARPDDADAVVIFCSAIFGGGAVEGLSATQEEISMLRYPEALLGLLFFTTPLLPREVLLVRGTRRYSDTTGYAHTFAFAGRASSGRTTPVTLLGLDAARCPGPAQFAPALVSRELTKAHAGFAALGRSGAGCCETGLWGCEGTHRTPRPLLRCPLPAARWAHAAPYSSTLLFYTPPLHAHPAHPASHGRRRRPRRIQRRAAGAAHAAAATRRGARGRAAAARDPE